MKSSRDQGGQRDIGQENIADGTADGDELDVKSQVDPMATIRPSFRRYPATGTPSVAAAKPADRKWTGEA